MTIFYDRHRTEASGRAPQITDDGRMRLDCIATRTGVFDYLQRDGSVLRVLRHPDDVLDETSRESLGGVRITNLHSTGLDAHKSGKVKPVGTVGDQVRASLFGDEQAGYVGVSLNVHDVDMVQTLVDAAKAREDIEVSAGYTAKLVPGPGVFRDQAFGARQTNIRYFELALLPGVKGRMNQGLDEPVVKVLLDSQDDVHVQIFDVLEETENQIRFRVAAPGGFEPDSFRSKDLPTAGISLLVAKKKGEDKTSTQAVRFDKGKDWTLAKARKWLKENNFIKGKKESKDTNVADNDLLNQVNAAIDKLAKKRAAETDEITEESARSGIVGALEDRLGINWGTIRDLLSNRLQSLDLTPFSTMLGVDVPNTKALFDQDQLDRSLDGLLKANPESRETESRALGDSMKVKFIVRDGEIERVEEHDVSPEAAKLITELQAKMSALNVQIEKLKGVSGKSDVDKAKAEGERDASKSAKDVADKELVDAKKEIETLKADKITLSMDSEDVRKFVNDRASLVAFAKPLLPKETVLDAMSEQDIKRLVVETERPHQKDSIKGREKDENFDVYLDASYDSFKADFEKQRGGDSTDNAGAGTTDTSPADGVKTLADLNAQAQKDADEEFQQPGQAA